MSRLDRWLGWSCSRARRDRRLPQAEPSDVQRTVWLCTWWCDCVLAGDDSINRGFLFCVACLHVIWIQSSCLRQEPRRPFASSSLLFIVIVKYTPPALYHAFLFHSRRLLQQRARRCKLPRQISLSSHTGPASSKLLLHLQGLINARSSKIQ